MKNECKQLLGIARNYNDHLKLCASLRSPNVRISYILCVMSSSTFNEPLWTLLMTSSQLVEHCYAIAEVICSDQVVFRFEFFRPYFEIRNYLSSAHRCDDHVLRNSKSERFSDDWLKTNTKVIKKLRPITTGANSAMNQSEFLAITVHLLKAREDRPMFRFPVTSAHEH